MEHSNPVTTLKPPRKRRSWWGWIWRALLVLLVLTVIFHRPIIFGLVRLGANFAEKSAKLRIEYHLSGSIFTNLQIKDLRILPTGPGVVKKITLGVLQLNYHPTKLFQSGKLEVLDTVIVQDVLVDLDATKAPPPKRVRRKKSDPKVPSPLPARLEIAGVTVKVETPNGPLEVKDANVTLLPDRAGIVRVDKLALPNMPVLENLAATTSYKNRDLIIEKLRLLENLVIDRVELDASRAAEQMLAIRLAATAFGGSISTNLALTNLGTTNDLALTAEAQKISLTELGKLVPAAAKVSGSLDSFNLELNGEADNLETWTGSVQGHLTEPGFGEVSFTRGDIRALLRDGQVRLENVQIQRGEQTVSLDGTLQLPGKPPEGKPFLADVKFRVAIPQVAALAPKVFTGGAFSATGTLVATPERIQAKVDFDGPDLALKQGQIKALRGKVDFTKEGLKEKNVPWWKGTTSGVDFSVGPLLMAGYQIDRAEGKVRSKADQVKIGPLLINKGTNFVRTEGQMVLSGEEQPMFPGVLDLTVKIEAPLLREMAADPANPIIEGALLGNVALHMDSPNPEVKVHLEGSALSHRGVALGTLALDVTMQDQIARLTSCLLAMPNLGYVQATGSYDTRPDGKYAAQMSTNLPDLAYFKPLLGPALLEKPLAGSLQVDFTGTGNIASRQHEGQTSVYLKNGRFDQVEDIELRTAGFYTPKLASFPDLELHTNKGDFSAIIDYAERVFSIKSIKLSQQGELRLAGDIGIPLDLEKAANPQEIVPADGQISINLTGKDVDLGKLQTEFGLTPQVTGLVSLSLVAQGPLDNPQVDFTFGAQNLVTDKVPKLDPASIDLTLKLADKQAVLNGALKQALIQPLSIQGTVPFDAGALRASGKIDPNAPVNLTIKLPASSLAQLQEFTPMITTIDGTIGLDVGVSGTIGQPKFSGGLQTNVKLLRFKDNALPVIRSVEAAFGFQENVLRINKLTGNLAGGVFNGGGSVNLTNPKEPTLDIALGGKSILFLRNDNVIVRSDLDLTLRGPLATAELAGVIGLTDSRFFREIDVLPINLPGRPAPSLPATPSAPSITAAPVRDWKFNVRIETKDDFLIRGNLANGDIKVDLLLGGTGLAPFLEGNVQIYNMLASLPFSRLKIDYGNIYFGRELSPLAPILDIRGSSRVRDYLVDVYIWGGASKPSTLFLSQPPLSQEDILTLIATGVTQTEITANPQLLAGRAGMLVLQKYYNKIFKRKGTTTATESDSPLKDVDIQIGAIDPKTGRESATARMLLSDRWQIVGDLDVSGGVRGQLRYLVHFK